jgi:hypothetical protein
MASIVAARTVATVAQIPVRCRTRYEKRRVVDRVHRPDEGTIEPQDHDLFLMYAG